MSTARATRSANGCRTEPKLENDSIATRGSMSNTRAVSAARTAISASSSAVGWMFTIVSAQKNTRSFSTSTCAADTRDTPSFRPTIWMAGRMVSGNALYIPPTKPSASPRCTIMRAKTVGSRMRSRAAGRFTPLRCLSS